MNTEPVQLIECPECNAIVGEQRTSGHLRWMFCGNCEASWRAPWTTSDKRTVQRAPRAPELTLVA